MIACVIPARFHSKRFPGKLLKRAAEKTVLERTFASATSAKALSHIFVATDDEKIAEHVRALHGEVIWTSPSCESGTERVLEAFSQNLLLQQAKIIVNLQADHPLISGSTIDAMIAALQAEPNALLSTPVAPISYEEFLAPQVVKCVFDQHFRALYFSRSPIPYQAKGEHFQAFGHVGAYCYRTSFFPRLQTLAPSLLSQKEDLEQLKILEAGEIIRVTVVKEKIFGVDLPSDLVKLEEILCVQNSSLSQEASSLL